MQWQIELDVSDFKELSTVLNLKTRAKYLSQLLTHHRMCEGGSNAIRKRLRQSFAHSTRGSKESAPLQPHKARVGETILSL